MKRLNSSDIDGDDTEDEEDHDDHGNGRQKSAALNVFLSSINAAQVMNQQQQQQEEIERISRLKKLANMPLPHKVSNTESPSGANAPDLPIEYDTMITPPPPNAERTMYNTPYDPTQQNTLLSKPEITEKKPKKKSTLSGLRRKTNKNKSENTNIRNRQRTKSNTDETHTNQLTIPLNTVNTTKRPKGHTMAYTTTYPSLKRIKNGKRTVCKRLRKIILSPIIAASAAAFVVNICVIPFLCQWNHIYKIYHQFMNFALYIVGALLAVFFEQRLNIFKFAAQNHQDKKSKILERLSGISEK